MINKNAYLRYQVLDRCFANRFKKYSIADLLREVNNELNDFYGEGLGIQRRQLYDDIRFMESDAGGGIDLEKTKEGRTVFYAYKDPNFSINKKEMSDAELDTINSALMVLHRFKGLPQFSWVNELVPKLKSTLQNTEDREVIFFDENEFLKGIEFLPELYNYIVQKTVLKIEYLSFHSDQAKTHIVHPYFLKQYNKRWFLFGKTEGYNTLSNFPLDRMAAIEKTNLPYQANNQNEYTELFEDIIGVSINKDAEVVKIELLFNTNAAPYVATKPLHGSQKKLREQENGTVFEIEVQPNFELFQTLLAFGDRLEVLSPAAIRRDFGRIAAQLVKIYPEN